MKLERDESFAEQSESEVPSLVTTNSAEPLDKRAKNDVELHHQHAILASLRKLSKQLLAC